MLKQIALVFAAAQLAACGFTPNVPPSQQMVKPELDQTGEMQALVSANGGAPLTVFEAFLKQGVPKKVAQEALMKFDTFSSEILKKDFMVIVDMTQHSSKDRFYILNRASGKVEAIPAAHGEGSDPKNTGWARYFSNVPDSKMTSLGAYLIQETYKGKYGRQIRLDGLEKTNRNARDRGIVLHPAPYVREGKYKQGRSWGCPAIPTSWIKKAINRLAGGSFMYIYGLNKHDETEDEVLLRQWNLLPKAQWPDESED
jgi:hypothetical protein